MRPGKPLERVLTRHDVNHQTTSANLLMENRQPWPLEVLGVQFIIMHSSTQETVTLTLYCLGRDMLNRSVWLTASLYMPHDVRINSSQAPPKFSIFHT